MPLTIKQIQDALISRIHKAVPELNRKTVVPFIGSSEDLFEKGSKVFNFPFCGVGFMGALPEEQNTANTKFKENYSFILLLVAEDTRGTQYALNKVQKLIDQVRDILIGWKFTSFTGLNPLEIGETALESIVHEKNVAAYTMEITTHQIQE